MTSERRTRASAAALLLAIALGACQGEKKAQTPGSAGGEVLPGSASDAMLPVDQVRSQPPLAPKATGSAGVSGAKGKSAEAAAEVAPAEAAAPEEAAPEAPAEAE